VRSLIILAGTCVLGALLVPTVGIGATGTQTLNPPPPSYYTCKPVGEGTHCEGNPPVESYGPIDTALEGPPIVCGSGPDAFEVFDAGTDVVTASRTYDADGNLVRKVLTDDYTFAEFSNPLSGAVVPYSQSDRGTYTYAVPGDVGSATLTMTWNIHFQLPGAGAFENTGRTIQAPDGSTEFRAGRLDYWVLFEDGDTSVLRPLCAALA
jgi:hypothetical protein